MVSERSVLRPQSMDEMEQQIMFEMSENLQKQKQSTEAIKFQIKELLQSQAKLQAKLIESQKNLETVMPRFFSQTSIPLRPPSQPPDPPDFDKSNLKFDGKLIDGTLLREWVLRCEQFFMKNNIPPEQKVRIISIHMEGEAFHWHCDFIRNRFGIFPSWPDYIVALSAKFGKLFDDPLSELMSLKQCGDSVETYLEKFDRALSRLSLSMPHAVNIFLSNMNPHLASHVKQFDVTTVAYAAWVAKLFEPSLLHTTAIQPRAPFSPYQNQNNQFHYNSPNTTSSLPLLETTKLPYKPNIPTETDMEKSPKKLCCEEIQESGMTGMCMSSDGSCHLESKKSQIFVKECEDASMSGDEASHETNSVLEKETIPSSALCQRVPVALSQNNNVTQQEELKYDMETIVENGLVQEHESLGLTDSGLKVDCVHSQEFSSQFQVPIPSLEPSPRHHKESLVVVNDLSYDHGCVIGKTIESICDSELGQDNSLDEEEFKGLKLGKLSKNERRLSIVCLLGIMDKSCWTQFPSLRKANEMSLRERARWKRSERQRTYNKAWKFKYIQRLILSVLLQREQYKLLQGRTIKCKMRKKEVLRRIKQSIFIEMQFHMKNNSEFNFQTNTKDAELETTLIDRDTFQKPLEDFYRACAYDYMALRVLELIKDKASRKTKLYKNWWFKYKLNTWLSGALHHTGFVKNIQTFSPMINDTHWDKESWIKLNPESCKGGFLLEFLKRHEARFDMIKVPNNTKFFKYLKLLVLSYILRIEDVLKGCKFVKFTMEQSEKPWITILSYEMFHSPRPPELSCGKEDEQSFVLNLIEEQTRDWSFFGLLLQWKWHPPPQSTSEFHQAHNDKPSSHQSFIFEDKDDLKEGVL